MVTVKFKLILLCLLALSCATLDAQSTAADQLLKTEQLRFDAMIRKDTAVISPLLGDELIYIHSNALKESKKEHLATISSGKIVYQEMKRESATVRIYRKTGISSGTVKVKGLINNNPFDIGMLYTAVYQRRKGVWVLINWQTTRLP